MPPPLPLRQRTSEWTRCTADPYRWPRMPVPTVTLPEFIQKWAASTRTERAAAQEHFIDLCRLLGQPTPNEDATGEDYAFEKGAAKTEGGDGWADVWKREHFAW